MAEYDYGRDFMRLPRAVFRALQRDGASLQVYLACLDRARYTARTELIGSRGLVDLGAGEAVFGRAELAALLGLTEAKVRTAIERLVALDVLAIRGTSRGTVVTVLGYGENAEAEQAKPPAPQPTDRRPNTGTSPADNRPIASEQPADHQPIATNKTEDERRKTGDGNPGTYTRVRERHPAAGAIASRTWEIAAKARGELAAANVAGLPPWPLMHDANHPGWQALLDRVCELLVDSAPEQAEQICTNRVAVAKAKAKADGEGSWFASTSMFTPNSFAHWSQLDPAQFGRKPPKRTERAGGAIGSATPRTDHGEGMRSPKEVM